MGIWQFILFVPSLLAIFFISKLFILNFGELEKGQWQ
jgi:hypothetical protein